MRWIAVHVNLLTRHIVNLDTLSQHCPYKQGLTVTTCFHSPGILTSLASSPTCKYPTVIRASNPKYKRRLFYPSETKIFPSLSTATSVGLQKWLSSFPGKNCVPSVSEGFFSPGGNLKTCRKYNEQTAEKLWITFKKRYYVYENC